MSLSFKQPPFAAIQKLLIFSICCIFSVSAWSPQLKFSRILYLSHSHETRIHSSSAISSIDEISSDSANSQIQNTRRRFLNVAAMNFCLMGAAAVPAVFAADAPLPPGTKYISGKSPVLPGEVKKKSGDTKGTRKDPDFLRSISDCKNGCQTSRDSDGLARSKEDCLSECQDVCCKTYEQCTFNIVPRI
jgi:hypothetical protein